MRSGNLVRLLRGGEGKEESRDRKEKLNSPSLFNRTILKIRQVNSGEEAPCHTKGRDSILLFS